MIEPLSQPLSHPIPELPRSGPLPCPLGVDDAAATLKAERIILRGVQYCTFVCQEFTSLCPRTGQPDFGKLEIIYAPQNYGLESKALKFYLWAFRDAGMFCEELAARIADDVFAAIEPRSLTVHVEQFTRGGISLRVTADRTAPHL